MAKNPIQTAMEIRPFTREPLRFLDPEGRPVVDFDPEIHLNLPQEKLLRMYRDMVLTREIDRMCWILQRQGKAAFHISITGQEAAHVGSLYALEPHDWVMPYYRNQPASHVRGALLVEIFAQVLGTRLDPLKGRQMPGHFGRKASRMFVLGSPVGLGHVVAMGAARALQYRKEKAVVISYGGEGSTSEPHFHSAMNFAGVYRVPLIVFIVNNQYAISVPRSLQTASETIAIKAKAYGFEGYYIDGNDPLIVYHITRLAAGKARQGQGPTLIEALSYRLDPHSSADDDRRYRPREEVEAWERQEPLVRMRRYLEHLGLWDEAKEEALRQEVREQVEKAAEEAEQAGPPEVDDLFHEVYAETPWYLEEELQELKAEIREQEGK